MRKLVSALLYTAFACVANAALAEDSVSDKLIWHDSPMQSSDASFVTEDGAETTLEPYHGKVLLVNFWATWCIPCREEMPALSALQDELGGDAFEVLTIATGRNPAPAIDRFFEEIGVTNLPKHNDANMRFARSMMVAGLPVTVLINRDGQEIARLTGGADWHSAEAVELIKGVIAQ